MVSQDGIASAAPMQEKNELSQHIVRAAKFALRRGLGLVALCSSTCDNQRHGRGHPTSARGKAPLFSGWADSPIRHIEDIPATAGNVGIVCGLEVDVLDIDDPSGLAWATANQPMTPWRVKTGMGEHWYFRHRDDGEHGMVLSLPDGKSLHYRSFRGQVVAPHSQHWSGRSYQPIGNWDAKLSDLPYFNRETAERIRGQRGVRRDVALAGRAAAIAAGELPPSGAWTDAEVRQLLDAAWARVAPRHRSEVFRKSRFVSYVAGQSPCVAGAASSEAMNLLRCGIAHLLLPENVVLDVLAASRWATEAVESDGKTPWPWRRDQLAYIVPKMLRQTWRSRYGFWVSAPEPKKPEPSLEAARPAAPAAEGEVQP